MKISISKKEYCSNICEAKCCYAYYESIPIATCPKLDENNLCSIYKERYEEGKPFSFIKSMKYKDKLLVINATCGNIADVLKTNRLPADIKKQCCYYNPKLLEIHHEDQE